MNNKLLVFTLILLSILWTSCKNSAIKQADATTDEIESAIDVQELKNAKHFFGKVNYAVPPPVDLFISLYEANAPFKKEIMHSIDLVSNYNTTLEKAINFGIYASDLAYATVNSQTRETYIYFATAKILAADLGFQSGYDIITIERIENNMNNNDSLFYIIDDAYWQAFNHLVEENNKEVLAMIIFGGWLESVHIALHSVENYKENDLVATRILDQVFLLENLIGFIESVPETENSGLHEIHEKLMDLRTVFDKLYVNDELMMTDDVFLEIVAKITEVREFFI